ncbi:MAG: PAS domain S-box protein [Planctomycetes bacterium]|nr:PAS domain S-box protein [Planctomycetota bacterium]
MNGQQPELDSEWREACAILEGLARASAPAAARTEEDVSTVAGPLPALAKASVPVAWAEQSLRALLEALPDALVVIDRAGTIVLVNARTEELFGYTRGELLGQQVELLVPVRFRCGHVGQRTAFFGAPHSRPMGPDLDLWGLRKDGSEFPVEISLSPLATEQGTLVASSIRDVTARKREEAKFRTLVENIPAVTFIAPLDESVPEFYVSPQIEQLLGFSQREWLEDPVLWHRQLHPDDRDRWNIEFAPTCSSDRPFRSVYRFVAKDGHVVWVHGSAQLVRDADGRPLFLQGVAFDITAIKEAEQALGRLNAELERRVQERTEELTRSMAELREKTEELEQFAYVASHDLREPLRTLVNWPQQLAKQYGDRFDGRAAELLQRTIRGATRMRRLIDSLSHYSRVLRRDRIVAPVECAAAVAEACGNLQAALEESAAELRVGELPTVMGNQQQLMLLFQNLIGNGVKYHVGRIEGLSHQVGVVRAILDEEDLHGNAAAGAGHETLSCGRSRRDQGRGLHHRSTPGAGTRSRRPAGQRAEQGVEELLHRYSPFVDSLCTVIQGRGRDGLGRFTLALHTNPKRQRGPVPR